MSTTADDEQPALWRTRDLTLPAALEHAIDLNLSSASSTRWIRDAQALSERYRGERAFTGEPLLAGKDQALGYAAMMVPATYAQLRGAMAMAADRVPGWAPRSLLDLGTGPGTGLWASVAQWPSLTSIVATDQEPALLRLGQELARQTSSDALRKVRWKQGDVRRLRPEEEERFDLVVIGHVLNELSEDARSEVVSRAWNLTAGLLLIVEPGTPMGFEVVRRARERLLAADAHTVAPCAHDRPCPLADDWCHFPQRIIRPRFQRRARGATGQWEDAKYSFAAMARFAPDVLIGGRVIREPRSNKAYAEVQVSELRGIVRYQAQKRDRDWFRAVRDTRWGDPLAEPYPDPIRASVVSPLTIPDAEEPTRT